MIQLTTKNITIGITPEAPFVSGNCKIHAGDKLYLYSDGVYELKLKSGALWQLEEFVNYLCVEDDEGNPKLEKLLQQTMAISDGALEDDFTIVEIKFDKKKDIPRIVQDALQISLPQRITSQP